MGKSKAGRERLTAAERRKRAVELRKLGLSYQKIADQLGVSQSGAHKMVTTALQQLNIKTAEDAAVVRRLELERLDEWLVRIAKELQDGNILPAIDRGIRIMDRRARLLGLDIPVKRDDFDPTEKAMEVSTAVRAMFATVPPPPESESSEEG